MRKRSRVSHSQGAKLITGGTKIIVVVDTATSYDIDGRIAEERLDRWTSPSTANHSRRSASTAGPSGIRIGTPPPPRAVCASRQQPSRIIVAALKERAARPLAQAVPKPVR